jgi:hypothetical protein
MGGGSSTVPFAADGDVARLDITLDAYAAPVLS